MKPYEEQQNQSLLGLRDQVKEVDDSGFTVYWFRWLILLLFVASGVSNAMVLLSWSPITDQADSYFDNIGVTFINLLNVVFQIMYLPGTLIALRISERSTLRGILISGGFLTTVGCVIRLCGSLLINNGGIPPKAGYVLVLLGTSFVGLAQPFYINLPAKIASTWFAVDERDIAMTLASLSNPLGSATGSFIPALFVQDSDNADKTGIRNLLTCQFGVALCTLILVVLLFQNEPLVAPSKSAHLMREDAKRLKEKNFETAASSLTSPLPSKSSSEIFKSIRILSGNKEYLKIFFAFSVILGNLNALAALLNQLPGGYSSSQIGFTGAALIMAGFFGAFATGFILDWSKKYRVVLKTSYSLAFVFWVFFLANCRSNNFTLFIISAALLGVTTLPTSKCYDSTCYNGMCYAFVLLALLLYTSPSNPSFPNRDSFVCIVPSTIVSTVECSYPVPEDLSVGLLYIGKSCKKIELQRTAYCRTPL